MATGGSRGEAVLAIFNDADPAHEAEYHQWYWEQHLPERLSVPGFLEVCRYRAVDGAPEYFTWYSVRDIEVLRSPRYLERLANPTEWTRKIMPWFRNMTRCACRVSVDAGRGIGGAVAVVRLTAAPGQEQALRAQLLREVSPDLVAPGRDAIRAQLWETDRAISDQRTPEQVLRGGPDRMVDQVVVLHASSVERARACATRLKRLAAQVREAAEAEGPQAYVLMQCLAASA